MLGDKTIIISVTLGLITKEKSNPSAANGNPMEGPEAQLNFDETLVKGSCIVNLSLAYHVYLQTK